MAISYKDLGLVNTRELFKKAIKGGYAIPAYNFNNMEQMQAIIQACVETESPVILQVSKGAREYANQTLLRYMAQGAVEYAKEISGGKGIPIVLHLDHGPDFETCKSCIDNGFSSVMIDGSHLPYEENIKETRKVVEYAHKFDVTVEGELGVLAGVEDEVSSAESHYTKPEQVVVASVARINARVGMNIPGEEMVRILNALSFKTTLDGDTLTAIVPDFREDIEGEADLSEEVLRILFQGLTSHPCIHARI